MAGDRVPTNNRVTAVRDIYQIIPDWQSQALAAISNICHPMSAVDDHPYGDVRLVVNDAGLIRTGPGHPAEHVAVGYDLLQAQSYP